MAATPPELTLEELLELARDTAAARGDALLALYGRAKALEAEVAALRRHVARPPEQRPEA